MLLLSISTQEEQELGKMRVLIYLCAFLFLFSGCATYKKKQRNFQKFALTYPEELAKISKQVFPNPSWIKKGEPIPQAPVKVIIRDTVYKDGEEKIIEREVDCPPSTKQVDTMYYEDSRSIYLKDQEILKLNEKIDQLSSKVGDLYLKIEGKDAEILKQKDNLHTRMYVIIGLSAVIGIGIILKIKGII